MLYKAEESKMGYKKIIKPLSDRARLIKFAELILPTSILLHGRYESDLSDNDITYISVL